MSAEWTKLPVKTRTIDVEGVTASIAVQPEVALQPQQSGAMRIDVRINASLDDLREKAPSMLAALAARRSSCEQRWSFPSFNKPDLADGKLVVSGQVRLEAWFCKIGKNKIGSETADFVLSLRPTHTDSEIALEAKLDKLDLGRSLFNGSPVEAELKRVLERKLDEALGPKARLAIPDEFLALKPRIETVELRRSADGGVGLHATATGVLDAAGLQAVLSFIAKGAQ